MTDLSIKELTRVLKQRGMIYSLDDQYESTQRVEAIYSWGYILVFTCNVLPATHIFFDNNHQYICELSTDDTKYCINNGILSGVIDYSFDGGSMAFTYNLNEGAYVKHEDVAHVLIKDAEDVLCDTFVIILKDNKTFVKEDCRPFEIIPASDINMYEKYISEGYIEISPDNRKNFVNTLNNTLVKHMNSYEL